MCASFILMPDMALRNRHFSPRVRVRVHVCECVTVCACVSATPIWNDDPCILCVHVCVCACVYLHMCLSLFLCLVQETHHTRKSWVCSRRCGKFTKNNVREMGKVPSPHLKYSRETDYFLVSTVEVAVTVTRTHAQAYAHGHAHATRRTF